MDNGIKIAAVLVVPFCLIKIYKRVTKKVKQIDMLHLIDDVDVSKSILKSIVTADNTFLQNMDKVRAELKLIPDDKPLKIIISTFGGSLFNCSWLITLLKARKNPYKIYIKNICMSAGTLIALGAEEIIMLRNKSFLGKIDPQMDQGKPVVDYIKAADQTTKQLTFSENVVLSMCRSVMNEVDFILNKLKLSTDFIDVIKDKLIYSDFPHEHKFDIDDCKEMGLNVREPTSEELIYFD